VYFANTPARSGGALAADLTCGQAGAGAARVETVVFGRPLPGRYRVGVDHPESCGGAEAAAAFVVDVEHEGGRETRRGAAAARRFEPIVLELDVR
jgi:hypothetical protein